SAMWPARGRRLAQIGSRLQKPWRPGETANDLRSTAGRVRGQGGQPQPATAEGLLVLVLEQQVTSEWESSARNWRLGSAGPRGTLAICADRRRRTSPRCRRT